MTIARCWPLLLPILSSAAAAQPAPPHYEPRAYCTTLAARTGARTMADLDSCVADEAKAQTALAATWDSVPAPIRERCLNRNARGSYDMLNICIETELERAR